MRRLVGLLLEAARDDTPRPPRPARPIACPWCRSPDVHGPRPCPHRRDLEDTSRADYAARRDHDWHCHTCDWSAAIGDADEG